MKRKRRTAEQQRDLRAETALVVSLSTKLRLGPKSRAPDHRRAASAGLRANVKPWDPLVPVAEQPRAIGPGRRAARHTLDDDPYEARGLRPLRSKRATRSAPCQCRSPTPS
jgi:hypothetical protein